MTTGDHQYLIDPKAPLVFGTGRPLEFGLGGETLPFPFPTSLAGSVRAAVCARDDRPVDPHAGRDAVSLSAACLARLDRTLNLQTLLFTRPADAVYIGGKLRALRPIERQPSAWTNLQDGLKLVALGEAVEAKPDKAPAWWTADEMQAWLTAPEQPKPRDFAGDPGPTDASRTHVVIESAAGRGAAQGGLFRTTGRDFGPAPKHGGYAIWLSSPEAGLNGLPRRVGGEGRLSRIRELAADRVAAWPALPAGLRAGDMVRFVFVTPAIFERGGWRPDWIDDSTLEGEVPSTGVRVRLEAAAIARAQSYSGWQPAADGRPGPGRAWRVVPAGSVYWLRVIAGDPPALHGASLCEHSWLRDGWGRGLVGMA